MELVLFEHNYQMFEFEGLRRILNPYCKKQLCFTSLVLMMLWHLKHTCKTWPLHIFIKQNMLV